MTNTEHPIVVRCAAGVLAGLAAVLLVGCSKTVKPDGAAQSVVDVVSRQTGLKPTDVKCPTGVEAKAGGQFDCSFTGPEGPYVAHMRITKVDGDNVEFDVRTQPK